MASGFQKKLQRDAEDLFTNPDHFGEWVIYRPRNGEPRRIQVVVDRDPEALLIEIPGDNRPVPDMVIAVPNSVMEGIDVNQIDRGYDEVDVALDPGGELVRRSVTGIITRDCGMIQVGVR